MSNIRFIGLRYCFVVWPTSKTVTGNNQTLRQHVGVGVGSDEEERAILACWSGVPAPPPQLPVRKHIPVGLTDDRGRAVPSKLRCGVPCFAMRRHATLRYVPQSHLPKPHMDRTTVVA